MNKFRSSRHGNVVCCSGLPVTPSNSPIQFVRMLFDRFSFFREGNLNLDKAFTSVSTKLSRTQIQLDEGRKS